MEFSMFPSIRDFSIAILLVATLFLHGCASLTRLDAVPKDKLTQAEIPGLTNVRYHVGIDTEELKQESVKALKRELEYLETIDHKGSLPPVNFLSISGGGDKGAFCAGLLNGWTAAGNRPEFKLVTGVSTGGLIAPFAFLGSEYDDRLKDLYTNTSPKDIVEKRPFWAAITGDSLLDNRPLWRRIEKEITQDLLDKIAAEYKKGRLLLIGTTDLDARQGVIWNMTKIAASNAPNALDLFRAIMIASAAIPGAFPPVMIDVEVDGKPYQEMHVDGGTVAQVFVYPPTMQLKGLAQKYHAERQRTLYILRNSRLDPMWANTERRVMNIAGRAISSLIHTQGVGDLYIIYLLTQRDKIDYNLAFIPKTFHFEHREEFDTEYMRALYGEAYKLGEDGYPWVKSPPGFANWGQGGGN